MSAIILAIHLAIAVALVGVVLLQKSEGGGLGIGGGMSGFMTGRSTANLLTRTTAVLAAIFFVTSIVLALLSGRGGQPTSILAQPASTPAPVPGIPNTGVPNPNTPGPKGAVPTKPATPPAAPAGTKTPAAPAPAQPAGPSVPLAK